MKSKRLAALITFFCIVFVLSACSFGNSQASWAYSFVVWDGFSYQISDEYVQEVDQEIGEVTVYSDKEGTYSGNFSNEYEKGTAYYSITGISTDEAIAVKEEDGKYRKALREGKYNSN